MHSAPHRIRCQRIEVRAPDQDTAFALRAQLRRDVEDVLLPALEQAFDAAATGGKLGDEVVRIPRLAVQLRVRNPAALADSLSSELPALIAEQLDAALAGLARGETASGRREQLVAQRRASLLHYLHSGQLDWPDAQGDTATQAASLRLQATELATQWRASPAMLHSVLPVQPEAILAFFFRFLQLLPVAAGEAGEAWSAGMIESATAAVPGLAAQQARLLDVMRTQSAVVVPHAHVLLNARADMLMLSFAEALPPTAELLAMMQALPAMHAIGMDVLALILRGEITPPALPALLASRAVASQPGPAHIRSEAAPPAPTTIADGIASLPGPQGERPAHGATADDDLLPAVFAAGTPPLADEAAVLRVQVAGLVLAHPFLASLFAARGLLDADGRSLPRQHVPRAAALLHWLACGRDEVFEFELGFIKPLLGLRPEDALPVSQGPLDDADREECTTLLEAMIAHWPALRSTSVEGLRVSFLQRQGLLRDSANNIQPGWQLQPEPESFDMLLAQLPWSISIVRLPWMTRPIFTDWPTR